MILTLVPKTKERPVHLRVCYIVHQRRRVDSCLLAAMILQMGSLATAFFVLCELERPPPGLRVLNLS